MIAADSSTLIAYIQTDAGEDVALLDAALLAGQAVLPPVVLAEVLSDPHLPPGHAALIQEIKLLELMDGYWQRVAQLRVKLISRKLRAPMADAMIAQSCIDHDVPLITRDADFRHFAKHCGLKLA